jgi:hypothetical protein
MHIDLEMPIESAAFDTAWIRLCAARLARLDALLDPDDAECIAAEMCRHDHWRSMRPGLAAASVTWETADRRRQARFGRHDGMAALSDAPAP